MFNKKVKLTEKARGNNEKDLPETIQAKLISDEGVEAGPPVTLPINVTVEQLKLICNALLNNEDNTPYLFFFEEKEIKSSLVSSLDIRNIDTENVLEIVYQPQAVFRVRPVTRCTSSIPGHAEAVVSLSFSPDSKHLASGSGDTTVRFWDLNTETPHFTCTGHKNWVLCVVWSPDGAKLASACKSGIINLWDPETGKQIGKSLQGHKKWINCLSWEPYHDNPTCKRLASAGSDGDVRIWDTVLGRSEMVLAGHLDAVTAVRWGGSGLIYTSSKDRTIKMWRAQDGVLCRTLKGHGHWVNQLALNTDYVLRTGFHEPVMDKFKETSDDNEHRKAIALQRYKKVCPDGVESLVSCSDDFTLYLWRSDHSKSIARMTGHQNVVNDVKYSPNVKLIASASFDKSIRLWKASDGAFLCTFRGHVQAAYTIAWSADSRLILSGSRDSTVKVWNVESKKLCQDLPGHADEVFGVDWAPDGSKVATAGKDKVIKLWQY